jgi:hypothetical protein
VQGHRRLNQPRRNLTGIAVAIGRGVSVPFPLYGNQVTLDCLRVGMLALAHQDAHL